MPVYCYRCESCKATFEVRHGMFFEEQRCVKCHSDEVFRLPQGLLSRSMTKSKVDSSKPGKIVDKYIRDAKQEIKKEKEKLRSEEI